MNDDIEILDIFDNNNKKEAKKEVLLVNKNEDKKDNKENMKRSKKRRRVKTKAIQVVFCGMSALFILGCIIFYGSRLIKYYKIYNPKIDTSDGSVLLAKGIVGNSEMVYEGRGLYSSSGNYIYKGDVDTNYLKYNDMLWRITRINSDNTVEIVLSDYISLLPWNKEATSFTKSEIFNYLNENFLNKLDKELLTKNTFCEDKVNEISNNPCEKQYFDSYVKLLDINSFLNSVKDKKSYLVSSDEIFWLSDYSDEKAWHTNGTNVSQSDTKIFYEIKPVVKLKNTVTFKDGEGTIDNPYIVGKAEEMKVGSTVVLGEDKWIVYDNFNEIRLMKEELIDKKDIFSKASLSYSESSLKDYLNGTYLDSLSYKENIVEVEWDIGSYKDSIEDIKKAKFTGKVGIPNILDIKFNSKVNGYFTSTSTEDSIWVYENPLRPSKVTTMRGIRPCIAISKKYAKSLKYVDGVFKEAE